MATDPGPSLAAVLFTDLVGSTALRATLGEERADELRKLHDHLLTERLEAHGGRMVKGTGDGLVAAFASASDALSSAVEMQQAIERYNRRPDAMAELSVRIGVSVGDVSWDGGECFGTPMVEAARLEAVAEGGQIVCSDFVRVMARGRGGHRFRPLGELTLKGLPEPLAACEVEWERPKELPAELLPFPPSLVVHSPLAFVEREEELFTDLVGSTALRARLGEERADELRAIHDRLLTGRIEAHGGRVVKGTGDGLVSTFTSASDA